MHKSLLIILLFGISNTFISCERGLVDAVSIIMQLPEQKRTILVPDNMAGQLKNTFNILSFSQFDSIQKSSNQIYTEGEFYQKARSRSVQYIIISSDMINDTLHNFPWITNRNFRVCPGIVEHKSDVYYTLLVWDNTTDAYRFFKFLYEDE